MPAHANSTARAPRTRPAAVRSSAAKPTALPAALPLKPAILPVAPQPARTRGRGKGDARTLPLFRNQVLEGDCREWLRLLPDASVDLVVTSPPYADARSRTYGGVHPDDYVAWFAPIAAELHRVLRPTGSFVLNIKERVVAGERHTYVLELIQALRAQGWLWTEEYVWHKKNCYPGKWPNRFRDAWERCLHFTRAKRFKMFQDEVRVPMGDWADSRLRRLSATDQRRDESRVGSGFGKNVSNWLGRDTVYPTNVLHLATECGNRAHSAAFPRALPDWFIRLFTEPGDLVLDPFLGSGSTALAAQALGRSWCGIELHAEHAAQARTALAAEAAAAAPAPPARRPQQLALDAGD